MRNRGFTFIELLLVLLMLGLVASLAAPVAANAIVQAKESALRGDLSAMRKALDDHYADNGRYPQSLSDLVEKRYLRGIPVDPITDSEGDWVLIYADGDESGIRDVKSAADGVARDGSSYRDW